MCYNYNNSRPWCDWRVVILDKKFNRIITILINVFTICVCLNNVAWATNGTETVNKILSEILTVMLGLGGAVCVGKLIHIGILYMTSSAVEKSNAKSAVLPWIIGTIVCFGASWIGPLIISLVKPNGNGDVLSIK